MNLSFESEAALSASAAQAATSWRDAAISPLLVGLSGDLGVGKTTWVRAMLRGLNYAGRVPSPTFTLLEHYEVDGLTIVHLDLYRLAEARELEYLGLRDWLGLANVWLLAEWPERGGNFVESLDLELQLSIGPDETRQLETSARSARGTEALAAWLGADFN